MADPTLGYCFWPGVQQAISATMTLTQGKSPSVCQMELLPQVAQDIQEFGTLTWIQGSTQFSFRNCKVDKGSFRYDSSGMVVSLSILDRRWKWQFAQPISGDFNRRASNIGVYGSIDQTTVSDPQSIARTILDNMNEVGYDVSQLPNNSRPELIYDWDNSAEKLTELAESLGCRVVLTLDDVVVLVRQGVGDSLPDEDELRVQFVVDPPEIPDQLIVVGGRAEYQVDLPLIAVGEETDGTIIGIDSLSYKPAGGWGVQGDPGWWSAVPGYTLLNANIPPALLKAQTLGYIIPNALARKSVYRWYRVAMTDIADSKQAPLIPGWRGNPGTRLNAGALYQILPLLNKQVQGWFDPAAANAFTPFDPYVFGQFYTYGVGAFVGAIITKEDANGNSVAGSLCPFDFTLDQERGIVQFSGDPVFLSNAATPWTSPANLFLRVAVNVKDPDTEAYEHYGRIRDTGQNGGTGPRIVRKDEIIYLAVPQYDPRSNVSGLIDNQEECDREADYILDAVQQEYFTQQPLDVTYMGLKALSCDGAVTQVTWSVGPGGATTRASRNTEWHPILPTYRERRLIEQLAARNPVVQALQNQQRKQ